MGSKNKKEIGNIMPGVWSEPAIPELTRSHIKNLLQEILDFKFEVQHPPRDTYKYVVVEISSIPGENILKESEKETWIQF